MERVHDDAAPVRLDRNQIFASVQRQLADTDFAGHAVAHDGMAGKVGVGKLALYGREYLVAVKPHGRGIVMYTLHHAAEIRSIETVEVLTAASSTVKPQSIRVACRGIE